MCVECIEVYSCLFPIGNSCLSNYEVINSLLTYFGVGGVRVKDSCISVLALFQFLRKNADQPTRTTAGNNVLPWGTRPENSMNKFSFGKAWENLTHFLARLVDSLLNNSGYDPTIISSICSPWFPYTNHIAGCTFLKPYMKWLLH